MEPESLSKKLALTYWRSMSWCIRHRQYSLARAIAIYGYVRIKPLLDLLMEDKPCR